MEKKQMKSITKEQIRKGVEEGKTWADAIALISRMSIDQVIEMRDGLAITIKYTGLDMRQEFFLGLLKSEVENRARTSEKVN